MPAHALKLPGRPVRPKRHPEGSVSPDDYHELVKIFAKHDCNIANVAAELGWPARRATRAYKRGYPGHGFPPIRTILARDTIAGDEIRAERAALDRKMPRSTEIVETAPGAQAAEIESKAVVIHGAEERRLKALMRLEEERRLTREDAIKSRAEEMMLISINRRNALALNGVTASVLKGALALSGKLQKQMEKEARSGEMDPASVLALVRSAASIARFTAEATVLAVKSERAVLGEPIPVDGVLDDNSDGTLDAAVEWIDRAIGAVTRARERGVLTASLTAGSSKPNSGGE